MNKCTVIIFFLFNLRGINGLASSEEGSGVRGSEGKAHLAEGGAKILTEEEEVKRRRLDKMERDELVLSLTHQPPSEAKREDSKPKDKEEVLSGVDRNKKLGTNANSEALRKKRLDYERRLDAIIDRELLSKTNLKGNKLSQEFGHLLIKKITENLETFSTKPDSLVHRLEELTKEKLNPEYKSKLKSELAKYKEQVEELGKVSKSEAADPESTEIERTDLKSKFGEIIVPILLPLLRPVLESILHRITSKSFYLDIKDFFQNLFKIKSDPDWTFWKGFKRIFVGKSPQETEIKKREELNTLFDNLLDTLKKPGDTEEDKTKILKSIKEYVDDPKNKDVELHRTSDKKKAGERTKGELKKVVGSPHEQDDTPVGIVRNYDVAPEDDFEIDLEQLFPEPAPLSKEQKAEKARLQKLLNEKKYDEFREKMKNLNTFYKDKLQNPKKHYYPAIKVQKKEESSFSRSGATFLTLFLLSFAFLY